ncbi:MAG: DMT family transporter [Eubacterium sp.]|nr:DMT family transporter [Candidatus Colimonas fimequi]
MDKNNTNIAYLGGAFFSVLVGFSFLGIKVSQVYATSLNILCYRYDFAFIACLILIALGVYKFNIKGRPKKNLFWTAIFYVLFMTFQVIGLVFATSVEGAIFFAIVPIIVKIIASIVLKERSTWYENIFVSMSVLSIILLIVLGADSISMNPICVVLMLLSSTCMAINNVLMRYVRKDYNPAEITIAISFLGFIAFNAASIVIGVYNGNFIESYFQPLTHPNVLIANIYLGVGCILLSAQLMSYLQSKMAAVKASVFGNVSTLISILAGVFILGEPLHWYHIMCTVLIIVGVVGLNFTGKIIERINERNR